MQPSTTSLPAHFSHYKPIFQKTCLFRHNTLPKHATRMFIQENWGYYQALLSRVLVLVRTVNYFNIRSIIIVQKIEIQFCLWAQQSLELDQKDFTK